MSGSGSGWRTMWIAVVLGLLSAPAVAKDADPGFLRMLYPPELVMQHQRAVGLSKDQRDTITQAIQATQASTVELQWSMQDAAARMMEEMSKPKIDRNQALEAAEQMMAIEGRVKRAHLGLLIDIKNALNPEQQTKLDAIRAGGD